MNLNAEYENMHLMFLNPDADMLMLVRYVVNVSFACYIFAKNGEDGYNEYGYTILNDKWGS